MAVLKRWLTDILGVLLILIAPLLGWLPGPGGIPLFLAGLSLLSINHDWAKRLMNYVDKHGFKRIKRLLKQNRLIQRLIDLVGSTLLFFGVWIVWQETDTSRLFGGLYVLVGILLLLLSAERYKKIRRQP